MRIYEFILKIIECIKFYMRLDFNNKKIETNNNKLISLAPSTDAEFIDDYFDYLHNAVYELDDNGKRKNKTIGILGNFGTGKSSIVNTYIRKDNLLKKTSFVSMGSYNHNKIDLNNVERNILQQIFYSVDAKNLPNSKIDRIKLSNNSKGRFAISFLLETLIVILFSLFNFNNLKDLLKDKLFFVLFIVVIIFFFYLIYLVIPRIHYLIKSTKISIGSFNLEISGKKSNKESILDINIDELIYLFNNTDKEIVILEDLDRLDKGLLFNLLTHLKYINNTINIGLSDKNVQFIYCIGETIFNNPKKLYKYFDITIPILPYCSYSNSIELFCNYLNDDDVVEYISDVASYVNDAREVYAVINQYNIFKNNSDKDEKKQCLYLALYKVLYPNKFSNLYDKKGLIAYYISNEFITNLKRVYTENKNKEIDEQISIINEQNKNKLIPYVKRLKNKIESYGVDYSDFYEDNIYLTSIEELDTNPEKIYLLAEKNFKVIDNENNSLLEEDIFDDFSKEEFFNSLGREKFNKNIETLEKDKKFLVEDKDINQNEKIKFLEDDSYKESTYYIKDDEYNKLSILEKNLIEKNIFDSFIYDIISKRHDKNISNNDLEILRNMHQNTIMNFDITINNPKFILSRINKEDFIKDSFCLCELYINIFSNNNLVEYLDIACSRVTEHKLNFFIELFNYIPNLFDYLKKYYDDIWAGVKTFNLSKDDKNFYILNMIINYSKNWNYNNFLYYISRETNILYLLESNYDKVIITLNELFGQLKFENNIDYNKKNENIIKYIFKNNMYIVSIEIYESVSKLLGVKFDKSRILDSLYSTDNELFKNNLLNDLLDIEILLEDNDIKQHSSDKTIIRFLEDKNVEKSLKIKFLELQNVKIKNISKINNEFFSNLVNLDLIDYNWDNLYKLYELNKKLNNDEIKWVIDNFNELINDTAPFDEYKGLIFELCNHDEVEIETYKKFVELVKMKKRIFTLIPKVSSEKINILIENHVIKLKNKEDLRILLDNENIENKNLLLDDNYELIKEDFEFFRDYNEILMLFNNDNKLQSKVEYLICSICNDTKYETNETLSKIMNCIINKNIFVPESDFVLEKLFSLDTHYINKIKLFLIYCDRKDFSCEIALSTIGDFVDKIIRKDKPVYVPINKNNELLLKKLIDMNYIKDYKKLSKKYHIIF